MEPRTLKWDHEAGMVGIPVSEPEYELLVCSAEHLGLSSEWLASELFRAAVWKFAGGLIDIVRLWEKEAKEVPRPVFEFGGSLGVTRVQPGGEASGGSV